MEAKKEALIFEIEKLESEVEKLKNEKESLNIEKIRDYYLESYTQNQGIFLD